MKKLSLSTLRDLPEKVKTPTYRKSDVSASIVHFGVGNFHRAHQAVYCDRLLNLGENQWGIVGVSLRSPDVKNNLLPQDYLYTQPTLGKNTEFQIIGSIKDIIVAPEDPMAVVNVVADPQTQLVTTTITEKGYCLTHGEIDTDHPSIIQDLQSLKYPSTVYGYIAAGLIQRFSKNCEPLTVLCCDNVQAGGDHLKNGVSLLIDKYVGRNDHELKVWMSNHVSFLASMVDRVTPATNDNLRQQVADNISILDTSPVAAEPFSQWIIEDNFSGVRPPFDKAGALFVEDIAPYEQVKLRFLNAAHSILSVLGYLMGDVFIHEVLKRNTLTIYADRVLKLGVLPTIQTPKGVDAGEYITQVFNRFRNERLPYAVLQVGSDSSIKIQQRWFVSIDCALAQGIDMRLWSLALAAWVAFVQKALIKGELVDPLVDRFSDQVIRSEGNDVSVFLSIAGAEKFLFFSNVEFMSEVQSFYCLINESGIDAALKRLGIFVSQ